MSIEERRFVAELIEVLEDILLQEDDPEKFTRIGTGMKEKARKDLIQFPSVITHRLNVYPFFKPVR